MSTLTEFFKLLSDETRLRIVALLAQEDLYVCQICGILDLPQPKVSKHLSKLRDLQYVVDKRTDKYVKYSLSIKDDLKKKLILEIVDCSDQYPILANDQRRMKAKDIILDRCDIKVPDQSKERIK